MTAKMRDVSDFGAEVARMECCLVDVKMPYWVGGNHWSTEGTSKMHFAFKGPRCHGIANCDDGRAVWSDEGWDDPDVAWAEFVLSYSRERATSRSMEDRVEIANLRAALEKIERATDKEEMREVARAALREPTIIPVSLLARCSEYPMALLLRIYDALPRRPLCRECADADGTCPSSGLPCDPTNEVVMRLTNDLKSAATITNLQEAVDAYLRVLEGGR